MLMTVEQAKKRISFDDKDDNEVAEILSGLESVIRSYTHNNFQVRSIRTKASSSGNQLYGAFDNFNAGDTVQISESFNNGVHVITECGEDNITVDADLISTSRNLVTLVKYPKAVIQCAVKLLRWELQNGDKVGIKSETLSRHSVTYEDSSNMFMGYPVSVLGGLKLFKKARF